MIFRSKSVILNTALLVKGQRSGAPADKSVGRPEPGSYEVMIGAPERDINIPGQDQPTHRDTDNQGVRQALSQTRPNPEPSSLTSSIGLDKLDPRKARSRSQARPGVGSPKTARPEKRV